MHDQAAAELAALEQRQTEVLAELTALGRRAEDLAALFNLPVKRVRTLLHHHRAPAETGPNADGTPAAGPSGDPPVSTGELPAPPTPAPRAVAATDPGWCAPSRVGAPQRRLGQ